MHKLPIIREEANLSAAYCIPPIAYWLPVKDLSLLKTAPVGQFARQIPHRTQVSALMVQMVFPFFFFSFTFDGASSGCFTSVSPAGSRLCSVIASAGQLLKQSKQPVHFPSSMQYSISALQTLAGHLLSTIWAKYSSSKYLMVVRTGFGAV